MSKKPRKKTQVELDVAEHKHCEVCGRVIPPDERYCSPKCEEKAAKEKQSMERLRKIWIAMIIIFIVLMIVPYLFQVLSHPR